MSARVLDNGGDHGTRRMTTLSARPLSLRPSGLAESPLLLMGLAFRLWAVELAAELLEMPVLSRLGMMRTMAKEGNRGAAAIY